MLGRRHQNWAGVDAGAGAGVGPKVGERIGGRVGVGVRPGARQEHAQGRAKGRAKGRSRKCKEGTQTRMSQVLFALDGLWAVEAVGKVANQHLCMLCSFCVPKSSTF